MNKHLITFFVITSALHLCASNGNASANASASGMDINRADERAADQKQASALNAAKVAQLTSQSQRELLYEEYAKDYAAKINAAEVAIIKALIDMGKPITAEKWQQKKQPLLDRFQQGDILLGKVLKSKTPLKELCDLWASQYSKDEDGWESFLSVPGSKEQLDRDLDVFGRAWQLLQQGKTNRAYSPSDFLDFAQRALQDPKSFTEPQFVNPDSPEGKIAAQTFSHFGVAGTHFSIGRNPKALSCWARSPHLVEVGPFFLTQESQKNGLLAAALAHEVHHILFADAHHNSAIGTLVVQQKVNPYRMEQFQRYKVLVEERAESLAAIKANLYLQGLLQAVGVNKARGDEATECHISFDKREALLVAIQQKLKTAPSLKSDVSARTCSSCKKQGEKFQRCGHCKKVYYCGQDCQRNDWSTHKASCK